MEPKVILFYRASIFFDIDPKEVETYVCNICKFIINN